ncbi:hypothetical protein GALMADRAFT_220432 [Galerina marginata CBS 339.88]|uniref:RNA-binding protein VTS1 n=1 Tax=Galerina marginata (strain CBS 339.88) TaxID=685588 RepID=A0A067TGX1_GALM3|nr:hypothetical protein GALMADRAFT_220432 [Galerina marginata CBS 339.88]
MSLRPPSTSPSPSPGPHENGKASARQSMGPTARGTPTLAPASPRPGGQSSARPTSELLGSGAMFQTPEAEALDQWFENLQNYEATLEDMAAASLDVNFKEELSAIEQWFKVLSEAERTAALYSLLQHSTQVQIRFFITVLQQMARSDPMTALLSPAMGGSMQSQMEAKLASIKSPGLKSGLPASPTARNFSTGNRQSLALDNNSNYLSPESAAIPPAGQNDAAAATLAQQRAKLKASNAAHRISAPVLNSAGGDGRASWGPSTLLSQVSEQQTAPAQESNSRPKSTEFSGSIGTPRTTTPAATNNNEATAPPANDSWASMVTTPLIPMFKKEPRPAPVEPTKPATEWHSAAAPGVPRMGDPTIHRRNIKTQQGGNGGAVYDDNGNPVNNNNNNPPPGRGGPGGMRNASNGASWTGRGPANNNQSNNNNQPNRFGGDNTSDAGSNTGANPMNGLGMQMGGGFGMGPGLGSPTLGMGMPGLGMQPMSPFNMNMLSMMNMSPEAQMLAAQMAASGFGQPNWLGMQPMSAGIGPGGGMLSAGVGGPNGGRMGMGMNNMNNLKSGPGSARSPGLRSASSTGGHGGLGGNSTPKGEEDVDPALLNDVAGWLRSLRLHKYTPNFEGSKWQDMVLMDEAALEAKGVAALGARRKMLKTFELVRKKMGIEGGPPGSAVPSSAGLG